MSVKIIGCVSGYNSEDKRCNEHVDFSNAGRSIFEGEDFSCTYCGDEWKDGLTAQQRYERKHNVKHCDSCLSYAAPFDGDKCAECVKEAAQPTTVYVDGEKWTQVIKGDTTIRYAVWEYVTGIISFRNDAWTTAIIDTDSREVIRVDSSDKHAITTYNLSGLTWTLMENMGYESDDISSEVDDYPEFLDYVSDYDDYGYDSDLMNEW